MYTEKQNKWAADIKQKAFAAIEEMRATANCGIEFSDHEIRLETTDAITNEAVNAVEIIVIRFFESADTGIIIDMRELLTKRALLKSAKNWYRMNKEVR